MQLEACQLLDDIWVIALGHFYVVHRHLALLCILEAFGTHTILLLFRVLGDTSHFYLKAVKFKKFYFTALAWPKSPNSKTLVFRCGLICC